MGKRKSMSKLAKYKRRYAKSVRMQAKRIGLKRRKVSGRWVWGTTR